MPELIYYKYVLIIRLLSGTLLFYYTRISTLIIRAPDFIIISKYATMLGINAKRHLRENVTKLYCYGIAICVVYAGQKILILLKLFF